jgi:hypothetical protein
MTDDRISVGLWNPQQGYQQLLQAWHWAKAMLMAGHRLVLELRPETRSDAVNRLLHARLSDVSKQCQWAGAARSKDTWRRLFTSAWLRARNEHVEVLPALDGHGVDIVYASTTKLSNAQCSELAEYVMAWGSDQDPPVRWSIASLGGEVDPETGEIGTQPNRRVA